MAGDSVGGMAGGETMGTLTKHLLYVLTVKKGDMGITQKSSR